MKSTKFLALALSLVLVLALLAGCGGGGGTGSSSAANDSSAPASSGSVAAGDSITFTDMTGRDVTIEGPVESIVAVTAADCEIIYALGMGGAMAGRGEYCNYPEEVLDVEAVESGSELNIEQIIALEPDVVFMGTMAQTTEQVEAIETAGIPVVVSDADTIDEVYTSIGVIGTALGKDAEAEALVADMQQGFADIEAKVDGSQEGKTVYFEISPLEWGLWTAGTGTFMDEIATLLGLENVFGDVASWAEISEEQVLERDPDYIVTSTMYFGEGPTPDEEIKGREGWQDLKAVAGGKVFLADNDSITRPGPRLVDAAETLYGQVYG